MAVRLVIIILLFPLFLFAGKKVVESDFQKNFNIAKHHLSQRKIKEALPYLMYLNEKFPQNQNLKYLIGVCYAEMEIVNSKTLELLSTATAQVSLDYNPNSLEEKRVPIYVYYYLSIAYSQNKMCEKAEKARDKFLDQYPYKDQYYVEESLRWLQKCKELMAKPKTVPLPLFPNFKPYESKKKEVLTQLDLPQKEKVDVLKEEKESIDKEEIPRAPQKIVTKPIEYSTKQPLYGVQLGAYREVIPVSRFKKMKNVDAFMDKEGLIRYVVGHFSLYSQAESLLKLIREKGYRDAFVVDVNSAKKFKEEVVSVNNINIQYNPSANVEYRIQVGAFRESLPDKAANMYTKIEGIREYREEEMTYLTVGKFKTYNEAKAYSQGVKDAGLVDAFVVAFKSGKKISLRQVNVFNQ